jgi:hypothetical protein
LNDVDVLCALGALPPESSDVVSIAGCPVLKGSWQVSILLDAQMSIVEPAFGYPDRTRHHSRRSHAMETLRTLHEHPHDWFDSLEQSELD